jgi:hypothetical protein
VTTGGPRGLAPRPHRREATGAPGCGRTGGTTIADNDLYLSIDGESATGGARIVGGQEGWARTRLAGSQPSILLRPSPDGDEDVEGHAAATVTLRAFEDEDDTEGHALALHFPSIKEADAFRRRLVATGVLTGTLVLGAAAGAGWATMTSAPADAGQAAAGQAADGASGEAGTRDARAVYEITHDGSGTGDVRPPSDVGVRPE